MRPSGSLVGERNMAWAKKPTVLVADNSRCPSLLLFWIKLSSLHDSACALAVRNSPIKNINPAEKIQFKEHLLGVSSALLAGMLTGSLIYK
jgi:hypothetical protein